MIPSFTATGKTAARATRGRCPAAFNRHRSSSIPVSVQLDPGYMSPSIRVAAKKVVTPFLITVLVFTFYLIEPKNIQASDPIWAPHVIASLIYDRDPYLDEYRQWVEEFKYYAAFKSDHRIHSIFPMGGQLLSIPSTIVLDALLPELRGTTLEELLIERSPRDPLVLKIHLINAALIVALSAAVVYLIGRETLRTPYAIVLTATYAFGTSAYSTASRAMWQHGPSMLMLSIVLLLLIRAQDNPGLIKFTGLPVAASFIIRPTNSVTVAVVSLYVLLFYRKQFTWYLLFALMLAIPFVWWNQNLYGALLPPYFSAGRLGASSLWEALFGNLVSPGRGLLIFSPVMLLVPLGITLKAYKGVWSRLDWVVVAILALHLFVISSFPHWWAGHSFGPRFFADMLPYLAYFLIPVLEVMQSADFAPAVRVGLGGLYTVLALASIAIHTRGAISMATIGWNSLPVDVDYHPERLWDWTDLQFMRGLGANLSVVIPDKIILPAVNDPPVSDDNFIEIANLTNETLSVILYLPARIKLGDNPQFSITSDLLPGGGTVNRLRDGLPGLASRKVGIIIDTTGLSQAESMPAIAIITSKVSHDGSIIEALQVVRVATGGTNNGIAVLPDDIQIDCMPTGDGELYAVYGMGWYEEERVDNASWRWASSPAYLYVWADRQQDASLSLTPSSLHDPMGDDGLGTRGEIIITLPDGIKLPLPAEIGQSLQFDAPLHRGWNEIILELAAGYFRPSDLMPGHFDKRELAFSMDGMALTGVCSLPDS